MIKISSEKSLISLGSLYLKPLKYLPEAEVLPDFLPHLTGGIEELKTTTYECNVLTFVSEVKQLQELNVSNELNPENKTDPESKLILAINNSEDEICFSK